jgi:DNA mismatch repair protein MutS2
MSETLAALEFDRVLQLVASFARSARGRETVMTTLPRFDPREGSLPFRRARDLQRLVDTAGSLALTGIDDLEPLLAESGSPADARELLRLVSFVRGAVATRAHLDGAALGADLALLRDALPRLDGLLAFCEQRLGPGGEILDSASPALAQARAGRERHRRAIVDQLADVRRRFALPPFTLRRDRYCLPVPTADRQALPGLLLDASGTGATVFIEPFEVVELNNALAEATARVAEEEERILAELAAAFTRRRDELLATAATLSELDATQARVHFGRAVGAALLEPAGSDRLALQTARHPLLDPALAPLREAVLGAAGNTRPIVPLDFDFPEHERVVLLSGPNAGGKTVALKTLGLTALMVQAGIPVLAAPTSRVPALSQVWCHIGDEQNLFSDLSTFTGAMHFTARMLAGADPGTLVLYDELGSGTDPEEGAPLAAALLERLVGIGCWAVATAHHVALAAHVERLVGAVNAAMGYDEATGRPDFRFRLGLPGRSRGLAIAATCGVDPAVLRRARELLAPGVLTLDAYLARLQEERERLERERDVLRDRRQLAEEEARRLAAARAELEEERRSCGARLAQERDRLRRVAEQRLAVVLDELAAARARGEMPGKRRLASLRHDALTLPEEPAPTVAPPELAAGARVRLRGSTAIGTVAQVLGDRLELRIGTKRVWVATADCEETAGPAAAPGAAVVVTEAATPPEELRLLGMTGEQAREELERFLDRALLAGTRRVRVVHGHGSGTLRRVVRDVLERHPAVARFVHPPQQRGGTGVTEVELE